MAGDFSISIKLPIFQFVEDGLSMLAVLACSFLLAFALSSLLHRLIAQWVDRRAKKTSSGLFSISQGVEQSIHRVSQYSYLFGLDTLYQDFRDLCNHNSSDRALSRHNAHGPTYVSTLLGQCTIHTIESRNILAVTTDNFAEYEKGEWAETTARYMGKGVLVNDGEEWHTSRMLLKPLFRRNRAADVRLFEFHVDRLIQYLDLHKGDCVDFRRAAQLVVLDITTEMLTGRSTSSLESVIRELGRESSSSSSKPHMELIDLIDELEPYGNMAIELGPFALPVFALRYRKIMSLIRGIQRFFGIAVSSAQYRVQQRRDSENTPDRPSIIEEMLQQGMPPAKVQSELQNIFFAAFDTTNALLANFFDCVARHPKTAARLRAEIAAVVGDRMIEEADLAHLAYLRASMFETLRLHSPVTYHSRKARTDTTLPCGGGPYGQSPISVPKCTSVTWSTYALNRRAEDYGDDWAAFNPDRWFGKTTAAAANQETFKPFGSGPRNCLGQQFAMLQMTYIAARLMVAFKDFEIRDADVPFQEAAAVTHYNGRGTWIKFR
ncbi:hypothetical protein IMSHALPRED_005781 [Imshaugia aleurites]|uniref:Cytochrome P450 n=1 Tax=Imshaugia aleurites TaxID=172621 RepID=A0A8H3FEB3_9LECA|nr:hypothetical protein IMSHALPRED_005781 [Imshaugia aleurites]